MTISKKEEGAVAAKENGSGGGGGDGEATVVGGAKWWPRLTRDKAWGKKIGIDWSRWVDPDDSGDEKPMPGGGMANHGAGGMPGGGIAGMGSSGPF